MELPESQRNKMELPEFPTNLVHCHSSETVVKEVEMIEFDIESPRPMSGESDWIIFEPLGFLEEPNNAQENFNDSQKYTQE